MACSVKSMISQETLYCYITGGIIFFHLLFFDKPCVSGNTPLLRGVIEHINSMSAGYNKISAFSTKKLHIKIEYSNILSQSSEIHLCTYKGYFKDQKSSLHWPTMSSAFSSVFTVTHRSKNIELRNHFLIALSCLNKRSVDDHQQHHQLL